MKSIFHPPKIQFSGTNSRIKWLSDKMKPLIKHPLLVLAGMWLFYLLLDGISTYYNDLPSESAAFVIITTLMGFACSCIYFFWLFPAFIYLPNPKKIIGCVVLGILFLSFLKYLLFRWLEITDLTLLQFTGFELLRQWVFLLITLTFWGIFALIKALQEKWETEVKLDRLSIAHHKAELNPHFTLNLIGDISAKSLSISSEIAEDIEHFITILRYAYQSPDQYNPLSAEINAIFSYLHGQNLRFPDLIFIQEEIDRNLLEWNQLYMPKLLLLTLIENVFKHGILQDSSQPVILKAYMSTEGQGVPVFHFFTQNKIKKDPLSPRSGFGIKTVRNILDYFFKGAQLDTQVNGHVFTLNLMIPYEDYHQTWPDR